MKKTFIILFFICNVIKVNAQINLVSNPSLENFSNCPNTYGQINLAINWFSPLFPGSTSEYYNSCDLTTMVGVPLNNFGYQYARTGNAYAGIGLYVSDNLNYREYIEGRFIQSLIAGKNYCVEFYVVRVKSQYAIDAIGAYLSTDSLLSLSLLSYLPQISNPINNIITDTINWIKISGSFTSTGGEQFITIGNFNDDANTNAQYIEGPLPGGAYYFIDDVSVTLIPEVIPPINEPVIFNAFTPNADGVNDVFHVKGSNIKELHAKIINRWGQELFEWDDLNAGWDGRYKGKDVGAGAYFYVVTVTYNDGTIEEKKGALELVR